MKCFLKIKLIKYIFKKYIKTHKNKESPGNNYKPL